ncbi:efflux RND transporter periplasmic adaptor subunit [Terasakiella pusilla]|uniref:efflux RND transporter periplasmic adaptor subunit n=1 Tax=Terasakiella pusilla TaxID=64973 RepID=UPI003AA80985
MHPVARISSRLLKHPRRLGTGVLAFLGLVSLFGLSLHANGEVQDQKRTLDPVVIQATLRPIKQSLRLVGTMQSGNLVNVAAPFAGLLKERLVEYGMHVERDQVLLTLDTTELDLKIREAEIVAIKAQQRMDELENWDNSARVIRARNVLTTAGLKHQELIRKEQENKTLMSRGIIPKNEYNSARTELESHKLNLEAARLDLQSTLKEGGPDQRHVASLELKNAVERLQELQSQKQAAKVKAPVQGLVLRPIDKTEGSSAARSETQVGSQLSKGQTMLTIANTESLQVRAYVDEIDVNRIQEQQAVKVTGDAFNTVELDGYVSQISAQADMGANSNARSATFEVIVVVHAIPPELRTKIRFGMTAKLSIITYENDQALVVPTNAIQNKQGQTFVILKDKETGETKQVPVTLGHTIPEGVEILRGIKKNDHLLLGDTRAKS